MMKNDIATYFDILTSLKTTLERDQLSMEIEKLLASLFYAKTSFESALSAISLETADKILQTFRKNNLDSQNREIVRHFLLTLKDLIKKFKIIKLNIAFNPNEETVEKLNAWVVENLGMGYILDISVNSSVLGGAVIVYNGVYKDFSLVKRIEEVFMKYPKH